MKKMLSLFSIFVIIVLILAMTAGCKDKNEGDIIEPQPTMQISSDGRFIEDKVVESGYKKYTPNKSPAKSSDDAAAKSSDESYSFVYPENWMRPNTPGLSMVTDNNGNSLNVVALPGTKDMLKNVNEEALKNAITASNPSDVKVEDVKIAGADGKLLSYTSEENSVKKKYRQYQVVNNDKLYTITIVLTDNNEKGEEQLKKMMETFAFE